jgi:hypothetical protein
MATKALHAYYSAHAAPGPHNLDTLADLIGLQATAKRNRDAIIKAHTALKDAGFLVDFHVNGDSILVEMKASAGPVEHLGKKAARTPGLSL